MCSVLDLFHWIHADERFHNSRSTFIPTVHLAFKGVPFNNPINDPTSHDAHAQTCPLNHCYIHQEDYLKPPCFFSVPSLHGKYYRTSRLYEFGSDTLSCSIGVNECCKNKPSLPYNAVASRSSSYCHCNTAYCMINRCCKCHPLGTQWVSEPSIYIQQEY